MDRGKVAISMVNHRIILFFLSVLIGPSALATDSDLLRVATTTSIRSSGLLDVLVPAFEQASVYKLELAIVGTGRALRLGKVDVILAHAPASEQLFVECGWGVERQPIMRNNFVLVGPPADPAGIRGNAECWGGTKKDCRNRVRVRIKRRRFGYSQERTSGLDSVIKVNPKRHAGINFNGSKAFSDWLQSEKGQQLILNYRLDGEQLFFSPGL